MHTCSSCKFFTSITNTDLLGSCDSPNMVEGESPVVLGRAVEAYRDDVLYGNSLYVGAKFGCIHHQPIENK